MKYLVVLFCLIGSFSQLTAQQVVIIPAADARLQFAKAEIEKSRAKLPIYLISEKTKIEEICTKNGFDRPLYDEKEAFAIRKTATSIYVLGNDPTGVMYGGLSVAEALLSKSVEKISAIDRKPYLPERGIKFNIPLDLRTPSYTDPSDASQANIPEVWKVEFWREYFDELARNRMNTMTLWSLNLFPSLVHVPEFPEVSLQDVWRSRASYGKEHFKNTGVDWDKPYLFEDVEIVKKISISEKMDFWRQVMQLADDRGVSVYIFHWNKFTYGAEGKHGITNAQDNEQTIAYFRAATREMIKQYPLLKGIGITAGEGMEKERKDEYSNEKWLWKTYGLGINDALAAEPNRDFKLIHRIHMASLSDVTDNFKDLKCRLDISLKYAVAHMYSVPNPPFIKDAFPLLSKENKTWLTIRNDDIYSMRWANPDFARQFINFIPSVDYVAGYYMGPDGYSWGRDFLSKTTLKNPPLVVKKQWFSNRIWGQLSYDPTLTNQHFYDLAEGQFAGQQITKLMPGWEDASMIFPYITRFLWGDLDFKWFPEANLSTKGYRGFYTVGEYIVRQPSPGSNMSGIAQWLYSDAEKQGLISPMATADTLFNLSNRALAGLKKMTPYSHTSINELQQTQSDIEAFAEIGLYYAYKIRAAFALGKFDETGDEKLRAASLELLKKAEKHWNLYAAIYTQKNKVALYNRVGTVDMNALKAEVKKDYDLVKNWTSGTITYEAKGTTENVFRK